ncbi:MAG: hypothetical protein WCS98_00695 [Bacillota bacterium]|nr:hypothetical protein [Bacillota bacterium]MDD3297743.1 hypothetical protein [Bacillota bacterium]MDD3850079.1 hypothetical protein [Bacillota bacterium]MDD4706684.1 hypothetical protein [Bacillota bacterium]
MGGPSIMKRIISVMGRGTRKKDTEFAGEVEPVLGRRDEDPSGPTARSGTGQPTEDVYSKQEKIQERE